MLKFDISDIPGLPDNANITEITADLYFTDGDTGVIGNVCSLYVISKFWNSSEVTWNNATKTDSWKQLDLDTKYYSYEVLDTVEFPGGGDRIFPCAATAPVATVSHPWETYTITDVMKKYINNSGSFYGLYIKPYLGNSSRWYASSEYADQDKRPKLTIKFSGTGITKNPVAERASPYQIRTTCKYIRIYIPLNSSYRVSILNLKGRRLYSFDGYGKKWYNLSGNGLHNGSYILYVKNEHLKIAKNFTAIK